MRVLSLSLEKISDISEKGVLSLGFEIVLPEGATYSKYTAGTLFEQTNCAIRETTNNLLIGFQNQSNPVMDNGHLIDIEFSSVPAEWGPEAENVVAIDADGNDVDYMFAIDTVITSKWKVIGTWL